MNGVIVAAAPADRGRRAPERVTHSSAATNGWWPQHGPCWLPARQAVDQAATPAGCHPTCSRRCSPWPNLEISLASRKMEGAPLPPRSSPYSSHLPELAGQACMRIGTGGGSKSGSCWPGGGNSTGTGGVPSGSSSGGGGGGGVPGGTTGSGICALIVAPLPPDMAWRAPDERVRRIPGFVFGPANEKGQARFRTWPCSGRWRQ